MEEANLIDNLPDELLSAIFSFLPGMDGMRTSFVSHRWRRVWKCSSHLGFDQKHILRHSNEALNPKTRYEMVMYRKNINTLLEEIAKVAVLISSIIDGHIGPLKSCSIRHLSKSCEKVVGWMMTLLDKGVRKVSMELEFLANSSPHEEFNVVLKKLGQTLDIPLEIFTNFEVLELKNYFLVISPSPQSPQVLKTLTLNSVSIALADFQGILSHCSSIESLTLEECGFSENQIKIDSSSLKFFKISKMAVLKIWVSAVNIEVLEIDSISCHPQELVFEIPKLQILRSSNDVQRKRYFYPHGMKCLTTKDIIENFGGIMGSQSSSMHTIFENLVTLCIDFELKGIKNAIALSFALKSCHRLKNLQINNQVNDYWDYIDRLNDKNEDVNFFWHKRQICECVSRQLKSLCIKGYTGKEIETEFVKYIIINARKMERITIWFVDECSWAQATATLCLLSFPKASSKLFIDLKPGTKYMKQVGGSFQKWVRTLP